MTDKCGHTWTVTPYGCSTYLLTRPGAMKWLTTRELENGPTPPDPDPYVGLRHIPDQKCWVRA